MKLLVNAVQAAKGPKKSLISVIDDNLGRKYPARSHEEIHASDLTKTHFCPREVALLDSTGLKRKDEYIDTALKATFDIGHTTSTLLRERWLGDVVVGHWKCRKCGTERQFCKRPPTTEPSSPCQHNWAYQEVVFKSLTHGFTGSIDVIVDLGAPQLHIVEIKVLAPDDFKSIVAPLPEHRVRTALYLFLIESSGSPWRDRITLNSARVLYVSRSFGFKNPDYHDKVIPFREYIVKRDDSALGDPLSRAMIVNAWRTQKIMPPRTCETSWGPLAKNCSACVPCFSGKFP